MFRGRYEHNIDEKGRLAIPAKFRDRIELLDSENSVIITHLKNCLVAYPLKEWEKLENKLMKLDSLNPKVAAFKRFFISGATECQLDKAGRILLTTTLRSIAKIEKECIISGQLNKFEIWSKEIWDQEFALIIDQFDDIVGDLSSIGVAL